MSDSISRQAAIEAICTEGTRLERNGTVTMAEIKQWCVDILEALPSAQAEIICCKDCKYYRWEIDMCDYPYATAHNVVHEDDYCSKAERKSDG